ncbi:MAG TPA: class I fructose-bisphosphate aldolase, partial [Caulobacteraceae bacterium]
MDLAALNATALKMVEPGKGLLAADESTGTIQKRFDAIGVENTEPNRRAYRELLFSAAEAMRHISGVILFRETLYQDAADGTPLVSLIEQAGAVPGIKVDEGAKPMAGFPAETLTEGLDGLPDLLAKAYGRGARFAKWRAVITIGKDLPSWGAVHANAHALARYAATCQDQGLTPIVEPEVLMDGDHDIEVCERVTRHVLQTVFAELNIQRVALEGMILKPNMIVSGIDCPRQAPVEEVARRTVAVLKA